MGLRNNLKIILALGLEVWQDENVQMVWELSRAMNQHTFQV